MGAALKQLFLYVVLALLLSGLIAINFYKEALLDYFPSLPSYFPLGFGIGCIVLIIYLLWRRDREFELMRYEFISIATHKFRTPLTGIKWAIEALGKEVSFEERTTILSQLKNAVGRLLEIVDLMVDFTKVDLQFVFEATSIRDIFQASLEKYGQKAKEKNIKFDINTATDLPLIVIDRLKIQYVIDMLLDNAIKYSPQNGTVSVVIEQKASYQTLKITDSGIGMTKKDIDHLFMQFYRSREAKHTDTEGMGLGLYAAERIVTRHGGKLWGESSGTGKGSTFYLQLKTKKTYTVA